MAAITICSDFGATNVKSVSVSIAHIHKWKDYTGIKKNKIRPFAATWMGLETVILNEVRQTEKTHHMTFLICGF